VKTAILHTDKVSVTFVEVDEYSRLVNEKKFANEEEADRAIGRWGDKDATGMEAE